MHLTRFSLTGCAVVAFDVLLGCSAGKSPMTSPRIQIPPGMRAVSLRARVDVAIAPGTNVDVLVGGHGVEAERAILLQDIELASFEQQAGTVTLLTSPRDVEKLAAAADRGGVEVIRHH